MIPVDIQVSWSRVKVKGYVGLPHLVQLITQERFVPGAWLTPINSLVSRWKVKVKHILDMLGKGALVFYKHLFFMRNFGLVWIKYRITVIRSCIYTQQTTMNTNIDLYLDVYTILKSDRIYSMENIRISGTEPS